MVEMGTHLATERAGLVTLHLRDGAPQFYPNHRKHTPFLSFPLRRERTENKPFLRTLGFGALSYPARDYDFS